MPVIDRRDGYLPLGSYGVLGDGRTVALVGADGAVDWLPVPTLSSPPVLSAVLDAAHGGRLVLQPTIPFTAERRYRPGTAVLETTFDTPRGRVTVVDSLNRLGNRPLPWTELARLVHADAAVPMRWSVVPGHRFGSAQPWAHRRDGVALVEVGDQTLAVVSEDVGTPRVGPHDVAGEFTALPGSTGVLALVATDSEPVLVPSAAEVRDRVEATTAAWRGWQERIRYDGPHREAVVRSALVLELLTQTASGANAAAATTSLPEVLGGERNFDYRFAWVRDAAFAVDALADLNLLPEVHRALSWLLAAVSRTAPDVHVFYTLDGRPASAEMMQVLTMSGYRDTRPVHVGNSAASQRQLGAYGHLLDAVWRYCRHGGQLDPDTGRQLAGLADRVCDLWWKPDAGLWELGDYQQYTSSKIGCWTALDRCARLAGSGQVPDWHAERWRSVREEIRAWTDEHCWSATKNSYTMHADTDGLDAAVLLAARTGFADPGDPRLTGTIDAVAEELSAGGPLLYRYSAMRGKEGAFVACSFWLVEAMAIAGRRDEAGRLFSEMLGHGSDLALFSEELDPVDGELRGNFPQGLSHLALIGAARALTAAAA